MRDTLSYYAKYITFVIISIFSFAAAGAQQPETMEVKGMVYEQETEEPLIGVSVAVEGTKIVLATDVDGKFAFSLPKGEYAVVFTYIGMEKKTMKLSASTLRDFSRVVMVPTAKTMKEVVVTGIYTRSKESFTGSTTTFTGAELKQVGTSNVLQSLRTLDPAFKIVDNVQFGSDPNRMPDIEIRGKSSIMGLKEEYGTDPNQPLFILDGFETTLEVVTDLNMNRVASVTLLKDAASTAIYGSKAANGVVVIETVRPANGRLRVSYKGDFGVTMADLTDYNLMNASEKIRFEDLAGLYTDRTGIPLNQLRLENLRNERLKEVARGVDTYWLSEPLRTGFTQKHNIYAEGGEERVRYGIGLSYGNIRGVMKGSDRRTLSGNIDLIYRTGKFQFSNKLTLNYVGTEDPVVPFSEYAMADPYYRKYNADGGIDKYLYYPEEGADDSPVVNPLWNAHLNNYDKGKEFNFTNNFIAEYFATDHLRVRAKFGLTKDNMKNDARLSPLHTDFDSASETEKGSYRHSDSDELGYEGDIAITYGQLFGEKHLLNLVGGFNFENSKAVSNGYTAVGFTEDQFAAPSFANRYADGGKPAYSESTTRAASFYINGGYAYDNRYLIDVNYRKDGASMFGTNNRFRDTWSVGVGWNMHNEKFMRSQSVISLLKPRASVGNPGNQNFSAYQAFTTYMFNSMMTNVFGAGVLISSLGNPDLKWQETYIYTVGLDAAMFDNRFSFNFDLFRKITNPLLAVLTVPGSVGVKSVAMNAGEQHTNGLETTVRVSPVYNLRKGINWTISLSAAADKAWYANIGNSLSELNKEGQASATATTRYYDGGSPTAIWAVRSAGIDPATGQELFIRKDGTYSFTYDVSDEVVVGDTRPKVEGVIGTTFYWKGFSLGAYLRYRLGGQTFNYALYDKVENIDITSIAYNQDRRALYDRWSEPGQDARFKGISLVQRTEKSSRFVMDENTLSGESFTVGYEFPKSLISKAKLSSLTLQANMNDIFYISTVKAERGIDYPFARTVSFSLSATF